MITLFFILYFLPPNLLQIAIKVIFYKITTLLNVTDIENRLVVARGRWDGGEMDWEFGISRCKLLYAE